MSLYHITLLVTTAQEEAITLLFKERCWEYLKTGEKIDVHYKKKNNHAINRDFSSLKFEILFENTFLIFIQPTD